MNMLDEILQTAYRRGMMHRRQRYDLRTARRRAGLTQIALARRAGIQQGMISKLENGLVPDPRFSTVLNLARALKVEPGLLRFDGSSPSL